MRRQFCPICGLPIMKRLGGTLVCDCGWDSRKYKDKVFETINKKSKKVFAQG